MSTPAPASARSLVWDVPTRLGHAVLLLGVPGAFVVAVTSEHGPFFPVHMALGLTVGLVAGLRIAWGLVGTRYARFSAFAWNPPALFAYLRGALTGTAPRYVGHNPATSYLVPVMLALALGIVTTGIAMTLGGGETAEDLHEPLVFSLLGVALLHVAGVVLHQLRHRDDLVRSMVDGRKGVASPGEAAAPAGGAGVALALLVAALLGWLLAGFDAGAGRLVVPGTPWQLGGAETDDEEDHADRDEHFERHEHDRKPARKDRDDEHHDH
ncbi:MAG TPA: cytochrome b/b6 domain-containing protein [Polyangiaceae bacterium]|nr:cytochrome b/b6 domain-containing protein [Polyangiaceae bacterium]